MNKTVFSHRNSSVTADKNIAQILCGSSNTRNGEEDGFPMHRCQIWHAEKIPRMVPETGKSEKIKINNNKDISDCISFSFDKKER